MPIWISLRIRLIFSCVLWITTCDQLIHSYLGLPRFELDFYLLLINFSLIIIGLLRPNYTYAFVVSFLIPWLYGVGFCWVFIEGSLRHAVLCSFILSLGLFFFYVKNALLDSRRALVSGLENLSKGYSHKTCEVLFFDERGKVLRGLNQWASLVRERLRRTQFISPEIWSELKDNGIRDERSSKDRWVISLVFNWGEKATQNSFDEVLLNLLSSLCDHMNASINCFYSGYAELIVMEDSKERAKDVLFSLSDFDWNFIKSEQFVNVVVRRTFMKTGVVFHPEGYRFRCVDYSLREDCDFIRKQSQITSQIYIHQSLHRDAQQIFHLHQSGEDYCMIKSNKNQEYHLKKLSSHKVENRLMSIRVVSAQRNQLAIEPLIKLLEDVSPRVRIAAAAALSLFVSNENEDRIGQAFLKSLDKEWNQDMRASLVMALGKLRKKSLIKPLYGLLSDQNDRVRANAVEAVGQCMDRKTILRYLDKLLKDGNNRARANAAMAVWLIGERLGLVVLVEMARSTEPLISSSGLYGIGEVFTNENIKIHSKFVSNPVRYYFKEKLLFDESLQVCIEKVMSTNQLVERNAVIALGKFRSKAAVKILTNKFFLTKEASLQQLILNNLLNLEEFELVTELRSQQIE